MKEYYIKTESGKVYYWLPDTFNNIESAVFIGQSMGGFITIDSTPYGLKYYSKSDVFWLKQVEWMANLYPLNTLKK